MAHLRLMAIFCSRPDRVVAWANDESKMDTDAMEALQQRTLLIVTRTLLSLVFICFLIMMRS